MAFGRMNTDLRMQAAAPGSTDDASQLRPYRRNADQLVGPRIVLQRPPAQPLSDDPTIAALQTLQDSIEQLSQSQRQMAAPWVIPPPDAESFLVTAGIAIPAIDGAFHEVVRIEVPDGRNGVLTSIANVFVGGGFTDFQGGLITWQLQRNPGTAITAAERNYDNIVASLGSASNPGRIPGGIRIFENDVLALLVQNVAVAPAGQTIGGLLGGWFYPRTWDAEAEKQSLSAW